MGAADVYGIRSFVSAPPASKKPPPPCLMEGKGKETVAFFAVIMANKCQGKGTIKHTEPMSPMNTHTERERENEMESGADPGFLDSLSDIGRYQRKTERTTNTEMPP